ncbi:sulfotransferase [Acidiferrimicrobium sp. IK]|uniref:sulfotransferase family protein n=1 Tax=Acidiferrimicrobium sp. IK TaxID=2871700 RepID=UPI0021CB6C19|nr:sulfotransferase [Acidiferrimicrobium sp. IK]MCU4182755.1 sulfotransferase [Acidiferrimicrobium sp. IK]
MRDDVGTVEDLEQAATRVTGLDDFGDRDYGEGLGVLLDSYHRDAALTPLGRKVKRAFLRGALAARLLSQDGWRRHPQHADVAIDRPVLVTGLPRTGTTALHRLLAADPANQGLEVWLTDVPQPRPPRERWADDPVFQQIQAGYEQHKVAHPEFLGAHEMSAEQVEECWQLLRQSAMSISYECLAYIPTYSAWLERQDWTAAYARHRRNLQLIGLPDAGRRWVLKNPSHLFALDALMAVYPDALVVQTHRAPRSVIASVCSLNAQASDGWSSVFAGPTVGAAQLELWGRGADTFQRDREGHDPDRFLDVYYDEFVADPLRTVETIYDRVGQPLLPGARAAMDGLLHAGAGRPAHRYTLEEFGLRPEEVDDRFSGYLAAHPQLAARR